MDHFKQLLSVLAALLLVIFAYTLLHEGGHALAVLMQGGQVTNFNINFITGSPHISYVGDLSFIQRAMVSIAGPLFPFFVWLILVPLMPRIKVPLLQGVLLLFSITLVGTFVPLMVFPLLYWQGMVFPGEDVIRFIQYSGAQPLIVTGVFLILLLFSVWYLVRVGQMISLVRNLFLEQVKITVHIPLSQRIIGLFSVVLISALVILRTTTPNTTLNLDDYHVVEEVLFSELTTTLHEVYSFQVFETTLYDIAFTLSAQLPVKLQLINTSGDHFLYHNTDTMILYQGSSSLTNARFSAFLLESGQYQILLLTEDQGGRLKLGIRSAKPDLTQLSFPSLLLAVQEGTFSVDTYQEEGYDLLYHAPLTDTEEQVIYTIPPSTEWHWVSIFVVGEFETISVVYCDADSTIPVLTDMNATISFGLPPTPFQGKLLLSVSQGKGEIFVYGSRNQ